MKTRWLKNFKKLILLTIKSHNILKLEDNLDIIQIIITSVWNQDLFFYHISQVWQMSDTQQVFSKF